MGLQETLEKVGKTPGLEIYRILDNFGLEPIPESDHGRFYVLNSYIVVNTFQKEETKKLAWNIHFWIGKKLEHDEYGAGASLIAKLSELNNGIPAEYREMQESESELFLSYFEDENNKYGSKLRYIEDFAKCKAYMDDSHKEKNKLLKIKGRKNKLFCKRVPFTWVSIFSDDAYIFVIGNKIFRWKGKEANKDEWLKTLELATSILRHDFRGQGDLINLEEADPNFAWPEEILAELGKAPESFSTSGNSDKDLTAEGHLEPILWKVSNESGKLETTEITRGLAIDKAHLDTNDCFILDCYNKADGGYIYVWKGTKSNLEEKKKSMKTAIEFIEKENYGTKTAISVMVEGYETAFFRQYFKW